MIRGDGKDMMSVLLRANSSEDPKGKMSNDEIVDQISYAFDFQKTPCCLQTLCLLPSIVLFSLLGMIRPRTP